MIVSIDSSNSRSLRAESVGFNHRPKGDEGPYHVALVSRKKNPQTVHMYVNHEAFKAVNNSFCKDPFGCQFNRAELCDCEIVDLSAYDAIQDFCQWYVCSNHNVTATELGVLIKDFLAAAIRSCK